jgi:hypothetical protein
VGTLSGIEGCMRISSNNSTIKKGFDSAQPDIKKQKKPTVLAAGFNTNRQKKLLYY